MFLPSSSLRYIPLFRITASIESLDNGLAERRRDSDRARDPQNFSLHFRFCAGLDSAAIGQPKRKVPGFQRFLWILAFGDRGNGSIRNSKKVLNNLLAMVVGRG